MNETPTVAENGKAAEEIARKSPEAAGLLVQIMDANARSAERLDAQLRSGVERDRDQWKARAEAAEAMLERIQCRVLDLFEIERY